MWSAAAAIAIEIGADRLGGMSRHRFGIYLACVLMLAPIASGDKRAARWVRPTTVIRVVSTK